MREIKFRAWDEEDERMYCDDKVIVTFRGFLEEVYVRHGNTLFELIDYKLMQYTGLKDRNGKEIYEGDILDYGYGKFEVIWHKGAFKIRKVSFENGNLHYLTNCYFDELMIIGNIYENSELLKTEGVYHEKI